MNKPLLYRFSLGEFVKAMQMCALAPHDFAPRLVTWAIGFIQTLRRSLLLSLCLGVLSAPSALAEERPMAQSGRPNTAVGRYQRPQLRLRGDYEPNNLLLLVWQPEWEETVKQVALAAAKEIPVQVLIPRGVWTASRSFRAWAKSQCVDIAFHRYDTAWIRDYGPVQVMEGEHVTWRDFAYDAERPKDDFLPSTLASNYNVPVQLAAGRLDGGGLVSNGQGLCVMTDASVEELGLPTDDITEMQRFLDELGCRVLATIGALPEEQTGHADVSVQFLGHDLVAIASMDPYDAPEQAELLDAAVHRIKRAGRRIGVELRVLRVPMMHRGEVFYSYVNAVRAGSSLLVPSYQDVPWSMEDAAFAAYRAALPELRVVPIASDEVVEYGGALHCITLGLNIPQEAKKKANCGSVKLARKRIQRKATPRKRLRRL